MPVKSADFVSVVERCYEPIEDEQDWLASLFDAASPLLDLGGGMGLSMVREGPDGRRIALSQARGRLQTIIKTSWPVIEQLDDETYRRFYYPGQLIAQTSLLVPTFPLPVRAFYATFMKLAGAKDLLAMLGYPAHGWAFALYVAVGDHPIDARLRDTLRRLRIHVEASLRLRLFSDSEPLAILRPDGKLEHLAREVEQGQGRDLSTQTSLIEDVRSARGRSDPHRALDVWQALVDGRWSVVERKDSDGKRYYHAFENAPHLFAHRSLSEAEAMILGLSLQGLSGKEVAYSTGLSPSRISSALAEAAERLGFASREELLRVGAALAGDEAHVITKELTQAEHEVLALVRAGHSNQAIATARGTSTRTVANQVASLLRKTGGTSRRALIVGANI
ncbi:MAG: helix-turn-helix transcriptional regulator [Polyangiales bacterium]